MTPEQKQTPDVPENKQSFSFDSPAPKAHATSPVSAHTASRNSKKRKKLFIFGGIGIALLALIVGGWLYYTNPRKVLADSLTKTVAEEKATFDGKIELESKNGTPFKVAIDFKGGQTNEIGGVDAKAKVSVGAADLNLDLSTISTKKEAYIKINNAKQIADFATGLAGGNAAIIDMYKPIVDKFDNKWIKIDAKEDDEMSKCSVALAEFKLSKDDQKQLKKLFNDNEFVKTKNLDGSFSEHRYKVDLDRDAAEKFATEALKLESFKKINEACDLDSSVSYLKDSTEDIKADSDTKVNAELWINRWSHKPTKFTLDVDDKEAKLAMVFNMQLGNNYSAEVPKESTSFEEITKELEKLFMSELSKDVDTTNIPLESDLQ